MLILFLVRKCWRSFTRSFISSPRCGGRLLNTTHRAQVRVYRATINIQHQDNLHSPRPAPPRPARSLSAQDQIIAAAGYKPETHLVTTEDGYMLKAEILTTREMLRNNI